MRQTNQLHPEHRIVWAIDPFERGAKPSKIEAMQMQNWAGRMGYALQPTYVLSGILSGLERAGGEIPTDKLPSLAERADKAVHQYLMDLALDHLPDWELLVTDTDSRKGAVEQLLAMADRLESPWIVVSSHGRAGLSRLVFGSFAENLLQHAHKPVIFLSQKSVETAVPTVQRILFPTDFSNHSKLAFQHVLRICKKTGQEIILFYSNNVPMVFYAAYEAPVAVPTELLESQERAARADGQRWIEQAQRLGVTVQLAFESKASTPDVGSLILNVARDQGADAIALSCATGAVTAFLAGSVAHEVFRNSPVPVMVFGPEFQFAAELDAKAMAST